MVLEPGFAKVWCPCWGLKNMQVTCAGHLLKVHKGVLEIAQERPKPTALRPAGGAAASTIRKAGTSCTPRQRSGAHRLLLARDVVPACTGSENSSEQAEGCGSPFPLSVAVVGDLLSSPELPPFCSGSGSMLEQIWKGEPRPRSHQSRGRSWGWAYW